MVLVIVIRGGLLPVSKSALEMVAFVILCVSVFGILFRTMGMARLGRIEA